LLTSPHTLAGGSYRRGGALTNARDLMRTVRHDVMLVMHDLIRADYLARPAPWEVAP